MATVSDTTENPELSNADNKLPKEKVSNLICQFVTGMIREDVVNVMWLYWPD